ncbi:flavin reductase family protein [Vogesella oryzae]|uniref:flavin reductase family protein n=1 Tax=Vogesella oryzae TaxID=1735285 RepID=UPI001582E5E7|nr:flavin reductase family protein [Vogesella oryzae]
MPDYQPVELAKCYRLLNHGPTVLVTSAHAGRANVMAAAWSMPLDFNPPKVAVVIDKATLSRQLIEASGEFVLNVPVKAQAAAVLQVGSESGLQVADKFAASGLSAEPGHTVAAPHVAGCAGWLECKLLRETHNQQQYDLFIGEVISAWADPALFKDGHWQPIADDAKRTLHYIAGGHFFAIGDAFEIAQPD